MSVKQRPSSASRKSKPVQTRKAKANQSQSRKAVTKSSPQARSTARASKRAVTQGKRQQALARSTVRTQNEASERFSRTLQGTTKEGVAIVMLAICAFLLLALFSYSSSDPGWSSSGPQSGVNNWMGQTGALISNYLLSFLGTSALWIPALFGYTGWRLFSLDAAILVWDPMRLGIRFVGLILVLVGTSVLFDLSPLSDYANLPSRAGGIVGQQMTQDVGNMFGHYGTVLAALVMLLCGIPLMFNQSWGNISQGVGAAVSQFSLFLITRAKWLRGKLERSPRYPDEGDLSLEDESATMQSVSHQDDDILFQESEKQQGSKVVNALRHFVEFFKRDSRRAPLLPYGEEHPDSSYENSPYEGDPYENRPQAQAGYHEGESRRPASEYDRYPRDADGRHSYADDHHPHDIPWNEVDQTPSRRTRADLREHDEYADASYSDSVREQVGGAGFGSEGQAPSRYDDWPLRHIGEYQSNARHDVSDEEVADPYARRNTALYGHQESQRHDEALHDASVHDSSVPSSSDTTSSDHHSEWPKHHAAYFSSRPAVTVDSLKADESKEGGREDENLSTLWGNPNVSNVAGQPHLREVTHGEGVSSSTSDSAYPPAAYHETVSGEHAGSVHTDTTQESRVRTALDAAALGGVLATGNVAGATTPSDNTSSNVYPFNRATKESIAPSETKSTMAGTAPASAASTTEELSRGRASSMDHVPHAGNHLLPTDYAPEFDKALRNTGASPNDVNDDGMPAASSQLRQESQPAASSPSDSLNAGPGIQSTTDSQTRYSDTRNDEGDVTRRRIPDAFSPRSDTPEFVAGMSDQLPDTSPDAVSSNSAAADVPPMGKPRIRVGGNPLYSPGSGADYPTAHSVEQNNTAVQPHGGDVPPQERNAAGYGTDWAAESTPSSTSSQHGDEKGLFGNAPDENTDELAAVQPVAPEIHVRTEQTSVIPVTQPSQQAMPASATSSTPALSTTTSSTTTPVGGTPPLKVWTVDQLQNQGGMGSSIELEGDMPTTRLLTPADEAQPSYSQEELDAMGELLETRLNEFGVKATVVKVSPGPVITRFEIEPAAGVKSSKISNLDKDLARSLLVKSVRVIEVIQGRSTVGIEIPNPKRAMIRLRQVLESPVYEDARSPVTVALGQNISGQPVVADLGKMPHVLVAGTTGSGKSVGVNAMLISMLLKSTPEEVRMILIDPKMLELSVYDDIPHLLAPVVTDMKEAANSLRWCVAEMERRYKLMSKMGVRNIAGFNARIDEAHAAGAQIADPLWDPEPWQAGEPHPVLEKLPYIVVVIDEFADMFMIVGKKVEELIARLAQKARAAGIHLVLATQRPSVDVVTGLIKANIPSRIAFQVSSKIDSRTILDQGGAESLLGHGDMLYLAGGAGTPVRIHGAFVDDDEVHRVVEDWRARGKPEYVEEILSGDVSADALTGLESESDSNSDAEQDVLYDEAVAFVTKAQRVSVSSVQRNFKIGYNRASRLVEAMEKAGVVSSMGTNGAREVLVSAPPRD